MATPLLMTKLHVPRIRPGLVPRPLLIGRLNAGLQCRLTLVSAPAGFGKTTLLSEWAAGCERPVAWVSLDEGDNDPVRFLAYVIGGLQRVDEAIGQSAQGVLQSLQLPPAASGSPMELIETLATALVNDIAKAAPALTLVLDDYHHIHAVPIHYALQFVLEHQPPQMHLVVSTREDPPLPLSRLRARGHMTEVREQELRFTVEEAGAFLSQTMGLHLSPEAVETLKTRTEGWVAGLQLAALSLRDCGDEDADAFIAAFAGDDRHVMDYLAEEVLRRQSQVIQSFLLRTAILNRLSAPLCDALLPEVELRSTSQAILEHLDATNLFLVPLDSKREWYRYHHLFADLLRYRLRREQPERLAELHRRASMWYQQAGDAEEAIHHAFAIPDISLAAHLAEQYALRLIGSGRIATYLSWVSQIPEAVIHTRPYLCAGCGWAFALASQPELAERYVQAGEAALSGFEPLRVAAEDRFVTQEEIRGHLSAIRANCARVRGDSAKVIEHSQQALAELPADTFVRCVVAINLGSMYLEHGDTTAAQAAFAEAFEMALKSGEGIHAAIGALSLRGHVLAVQGKLQEAVECYHQAIEMGTAGTGKSSPIPAVSIAYLGLADVHYQRNELAAAAEHLEKALPLAQQAGSRGTLSNIYLLRARLELAAGDLAQAEILLNRAQEFAQVYGARHYIGANLAMVRGKLHLVQGNIEAATQCITTCGLQATELIDRDVTTKAYWVRLPEYLLLAHILLAQRRFDEALDLLEWLVAAGEASQYVVVLIEATILQALIRHLKKDDVRALQHMERALTLAAPEGYVRPFLDAGEAMGKLLLQAMTQGIRTAYARRLLTAFAAQAREASAFPALADVAAEPFYEPLTKREQQILRLLAAGLSSTEAAEELPITVSTVRSHIKQIYRKLNVHSREEATARARHLGLV